jgi:hypothetical protein
LVTNGVAGGSGATSGAGSIYVKGPSATFGDLTVDNKGLANGTTELPSLGSGVAQTGTSGATLVTDRAVDIPAYFKGHWVEIRTSAGVLKGRWKIASIDATNLKKVTLAPNTTETIDIAVGDTWRGIYRFDHVTLQGGTVITVDLLDSTNTPQLLNGAKIVGNNQGPPVIDLSKFSFTTNGGTQLLAAANGVTDPDGPILVTVTNGRTAASSTFSVASGAPFSLYLYGLQGDPISVHARDSNFFAMQSAEISVGTLPANSGVASISLQPSSLAGGARTVATVTLTTPSPTGGAVIGLTTSNATVAPVPPNITVASGATTATFNITTTSVATQASVNISATYVGTSQSSTLTVVHDTNPPAVTITKPLAGATFTEGQPIAVEATIIDAEVGVKQASAVLEGVSYPMTLDPARTNVWTATVPSPDVDPPSDVPKQITVTASDFENNQSAPASVTVNIHPIVDALAPTLTWQCGNGSMYPAAANATFSVQVTPAAGDTINTVSITITGPSGPQTFPMTLVSGSYQYTYTVPSAADGTAVSLRVAATTFAGKTNSVSGTLTIIGGTAATFQFASGGTISATDTQYENGIVIVSGGVLTIAGTHHFARLSVINGGTVVHPVTSGQTVSPLDITATAVYVACNSTIDVSQRGYGQNVTYSGATGPVGSGGGSHLGYGGGQTAAAAIYGNVYWPAEAGSGGNRNGSGGGIVHINATAGFTNDGTILANGCGSNGVGDGCAGGSVWITAPAVGGAGSIETKGGDGLSGNGAGGGITIEYTTATGTLLNNLRAFGGGGTGAAAGAGTVYLKTPAATYGTLAINNNARFGTTELPPLGSGVAQTGSAGVVLVTDRTVDIPAYFKGHWVQITSASNGAKNTWRVLSINAKIVTLQPNAGETINVQPGDKWRGVYRFDAVNMAGGESLLSSDPILVGADGLQTLFGTTTAGQFSNYGVVTGDDIDMIGHVTATSITATNLTLESGAMLTHPNASGQTPQSVVVTATNQVTIKSGASIDVSQRGYGQNSTYSGATGPTGSGGGSHLGYGGGQTAAAAIYGNVYWPAEAGSGGNRNGSGGGIVRINAAAGFTNEGTILANGCGSNGVGDGCAGGSVWITAPAIGGAGSIETKGGDGLSGNGAGGGITIEYTTATGTLLNNLRAFGGGGTGNIGGPGTVVVRQGSGFGSLTVTNNGRGGTTELPMLGAGAALAGTGGAILVTDRASNIPAYFNGHWIEIRNSTGVVGTWRILSVSLTNPKQVTLAPNAGETISIHAGDDWRGIYRFDNVTLNTITLNSGDRIDATIQLLNGAKIVGNNQGPPTVVPAKIALTSGSLGPVMTGTAGAVADSDQPITVFAQNTTTGQSFSAVAAADGSFAISPRGSVGDSISVFARDGNVFPLQSQPVVIGTLPSSNITPTAIPITSAMTTDTGFRAQRLAFDGNFLVAQTYPGAFNDNKMLVFDLSSGSPSWVQTIAVPNNTRDAVVKNGVAYTPGGSLYAYDLSVNPATRQQGALSCGDSYSVAVDGVYAYVGGNCGDAHIDILDVTNPKVPVNLRNQGTGISGTYRQLIPYGNYLIGILPDGGSGIDVVVLDRRNINNLINVWTASIAGFSGFRGSMQGTTLYVNSVEGAVAVIDLSVPTLGVVKSVFQAASAAHGIAAVGSAAYVAADTAGVIALNASDPANPAAAGGVATSPQAAWDVVIRGQLGIIAAEDRLITFTASLPPQVDASKISMSFDGHVATVQGAPFAVLGASPLTVELRNDKTTTKVSGIAVAANGSFSATIAGTSGDAISVVATDGNGVNSAVVQAGVVPFGSSAAIVPITAAMANGDTGFRARHMAIEGTKLAVVNYPIVAPDTNKLVVFDIAGGAPVFSQAMSVPNNTRDVAVKNGVAYTPGGSLYAYDLSVNPATRQQGALSCGDSYSVAVDGVYAYVGGNCGDGHIDILDVSNPTMPVSLRNQGTGISGTYRQLIPYGKYLIGITTDGGSGIDVVILDRTNINNLVKVSATAIPGIVGFRGAVSGQKLYVAGEGTNATMAVVDLSNVASPTFLVVPTVGGSRGVAVAGNVAAFGDGSSGVTFFDVTNPSAPRLIGTQNVGGMSWDVLFAGGKLYAAAEQGIAVINGVLAPPVFDSSRITLTRGTAVTVAGSAGAIAGAATPITATIKNITSSVTGSSVAVAADGSFSTTISGTSGDAISIVATDANGATATLQAGIVPFGSSASIVAITGAMANSDANFRARHMSIEGTKLAVVNYPIGGTDTNKLLVFDIAGGAPVYSQTMSVPNNTRDVAVKNGVAYTPGGSLYAYDLSVNPATRQQGALSCGDSYSVMVDGVYAYVGGNCGDGHIDIFDITNPKLPVNLRNQATGVPLSYTQLLAYGNYLIGISDSGGTSSTATDVVIIDRTNINNLVKVSATAIPGFVAFRGTVSGQKLYLAGNGSNTAMAVMDLSNVAAPTFVVTPTVGGSRGVAVAGNLAAFGDGSPGVTFFDVTNPSVPRLIGTQNVGGMSWDVLFAGGKLYAAAEQGIAVINGVVAPPVFDSARITMTRGAAVTVAGSAGAITGASTPITVAIKNITSGVTASGVAVAADGSFSGTVAGIPGDAISLAATDAAGAASTISIGIVPFGSIVQVPVLPGANSDTSFRARHMAIEGTKLAVVNYPIDGTNDNKLLVFDIAGATPVFSQMISVPNNTRDVAVKNGVAYTPGGSLYAYDLSVNPATRQQGSLSCGDSYSVMVDGAYAYVGGNCGDGHIDIFDVTNPKLPVNLRNQATGVSLSYTQLLAYGNYLIGISDSGGTSSTATDVVIIDRTNINNLVKVSATAIPGFVAFRGTVSGQKLYLAGNGSNLTMAVMDLSNVAAPTFVVTPTVAGSRGVAVDGNVAAFGDGSSGVTFFDVTNPSAPRLIGTQNVGGMTWDVLFARGNLYAAAEQSIAVISNVAAPPIVDPARITVVRGSAVTVSGSVGAVTGAATPITVQIKDTTSGVMGSSVTVAADGSFSATVAGAAGDAISLVAADAVSATNTVSVGVVPFGTVLSVPTQANANDSGFRSRRIAVDGNTLVTTSDNYIFDSATALVYDLSSGSPTYVQKLTTSGNARAIAVQNGVAYVVSSAALNAFDLSANPAPRVTVALDCSNAYSIAIIGTRAYVGLGNGCGDGRIAVYDLTNPKSPAVLSSGVTTLPGVSGAAYTQLLAYGANQLVGVTTNPAHALVIIDRTNPTALSKVAETTLPVNVGLYKARIVGHMLYGVTGLVTGPGAFVIVDLSNLGAAPVVVNTRGIPWGLEFDPATLRAYVTDGVSGLTVIDASVPSTAHVIATQPLPGNSWDAVVSGTKLYVASEQLINIVDVGAFGGLSGSVPAVASTPPTTRSQPAVLVVDRSRISTAARNDGVIVRGTSGALTGPQPITIEVKNATLGTSVPVVPVSADGSFEASIGAAPGDHLLLQITSGTGELLEIDLGGGTPAP